MRKFSLGVVKCIIFIHIFLGEIGFVISNYSFLNLVLHMSLIDMSFNIMSPSNEHKHDNFTYAC